jgi:probable F420-dependent oxidoreductase
VELEAMGYDAAHLAETVHDPLAIALLAADRTHRITLRTAVVVAFARSPTLLAYQALDAQVASGGRFELGLGTQVRQVIEGRYAMRWERPVERLRDHALVVRSLIDAFLSGEPAGIATEMLTIDRVPAYFNPGPIDGVDAPPILIGAVRPRMLAMAGAIADGVITHPTNSDPAALSSLVGPVTEEHALQAGRPAPRLIASPNVVTGPDEASLVDELARQRQLMGFLLTTPAYGGVLDRLGVPEVADRLRRHLRAEGESGLGDLVPDAVMDAIVPCAPFAELPDLLAERYAGTVDELVVALPPSTPTAVAQSLLSSLRSIPGR